MHRSKPLMMALLLLLGSSVHAAIVKKAFNDNSEIEAELSLTNPNRLMVSQDRILKVSYPDGAMRYDYDKSDGSLYIYPKTSRPFSFFITTKKGRHLSVNASVVDSLSKMLILHPEVRTVRVASKKPAPEAPFKKKTLALVQHMEQGLSLPGTKVRYYTSKVTRLKNGLSLFKKEAWEGRELRGEMIEIYNNSKKSIALEPGWFAGKNVKTIKLSKNILAPKAKATLYRVEEVSHG